MRFFIIFVICIFLVPSVFARANRTSAETTYFSCEVSETVEGRRKPVKVTVKFAVSGYESFSKKGELIAYPGAGEEGAVLVVPNQVGEHYTLMSNLNGQGGDLRVEGSNLRLWGDGAGYQFTELVVWDADEDFEGATKELDGYVRDYGPAYGETEIFKQFIKCQKSLKPL